MCIVTRNSFDFAYFCTIYFYIFLATWIAIAPLHAATTSRERARVTCERTGKNGARPLGAQPTNEQGPRRPVSASHGSRGAGSERALPSGRVLIRRGSVRFAVVARAASDKQSPASCGKKKINKKRHVRLCPHDYSAVNIVVFRFFPVICLVFSFFFPLIISNLAHRTTRPKHHGSVHAQHDAVLYRIPVSR